MDVEPVLDLSPDEVKDLFSYQRDVELCDLLRGVPEVPLWWGRDV